MMTLTIKFDRRLSEYIKQLKNSLGPVLEETTRDTTAYGKGLIIRSTVKGQTGLTQGGWNSAREGVARWKIWNRFLHATFLEMGTGLFGPKKQRIYPKNGPVLAWRDWAKNTINGWVFAKSTKGMPAQPAIKPNKATIARDLKIRWSNNVKRLFRALHGKGAV